MSVRTALCSQIIIAKLFCFNGKKSQVIPESQPKGTPTHYEYFNTQISSIKKAVSLNIWIK